MADNQDPMHVLNIQSPQMQSLSITSGNDDVSNALSQLININENNVFHEATCLICGSPYRNDIEELHQKNAPKKYAEIKELLKTKSNLNISDSVIDNHMQFHFGDGVRELQKVEYINKLKRLNSVNLTTLDRISLGFAAISERLSAINSMVPDNETSRVSIEKIKSSETVKLTNTLTQLLKLQASMLGELKSNGELIILPRDPFIELFNETISQATPEQKLVIKTILNKLLTLSKIAQ
jgi:hypothetical protein